jgi:hypothetical protein
LRTRSFSPAAHRPTEPRMEDQCTPSIAET